MRQRRGFVLVTVLAMLVILSLLAGTVGAITQRLRDEQLERQRQLQAEVDMASTRASVVYLLLTQRMTFGGLTVDDRVVLSADERADREPDADQLTFMPVGNEIALDGRPYVGLGQARFSLQDDRGLLAVNWTAPALIERFLAQAGETQTPVATQINRLLDYQDADDLYRLNSLEREGYEREGRTPPSNRTLTTPLELRRVKGWDESLANVADADLLGSVTVARSPQININTAPARVLQALPGVDLATAERVVAQRALQPFLNLAGFSQIAGPVPAELDLLSLYPSASGTLRLWSAQGGGVQVLHWTLTPLDDGGRPWREDYEFNLPQDGQIASRPAGPTAAKVLAQPPPPAE